MAYTLAELQTDIRGYTEVDSNVFTDAVLSRIIKNAEIKFTEKLILIKIGITQHLH